MDQRPIGVFDSGLGGLTAVRELRRLLPGEDIVYFGDTGRVPYGSRSRDTIIKYARQDAAFLNTFDPKAIVIACGTVSANALEILQQENTVPVLGVVDPAAHAAAVASKNGRIGLIGTEASIRSGAYERALAELRPEAQVFPKACPLFVPLVENGRFKSGDAVAELVVAEYLAPLKEAGVDTLVLGCTHYPLLREVIASCMGSEVTLIDAGGACAHRVSEVLGASDSRSGWTGGGKCRYFVSDSTDGFARLASLFLGEDVTDDVAQIDITAYSSLLLEEKVDFAKQKTDEVSPLNETNNPKLTANAKELRKHMTKEERHLWYDFLKTLPLTIHRQKVIGNYIVDFYCAKAKLVIELDGSQHYEASGQEADKVRDNTLLGLGLRVLRYSNLEINENFDGVCADILQHIATSSVTSGDTFSSRRRP